MQVKLMIATGLISLSAIVNNPVFAQNPSSNKPAVINSQAKPNNSKPAVTNSEDAEKAETVKRLLEITGAKNLYDQMMTYIFSSLQAEYPNVPAKYWSTFASEIKTDDIFKEFIPLYSKYYTNQELKELVAFYETPLGQKTIQILPQLSQDSTELGIKFGRQAAERALKKLEADGYLTPSKTPKTK